MNVPPKAKKDKTCSILYLLYDNDVQLPRHLNGKDKEPDFYFFPPLSVYQSTSPGLKVTQIINHLGPFRGEKALSLHKTCCEIIIHYEISGNMLYGGNH